MFCPTSLDTEPVPTAANWSWRNPVNGYWSTQGPYEVVGEHAAIASHFVASRGAAGGTNFLEPTALYVAIDWVGDTPQATSQRVEQVTANWLAYADAHAGESSDPSSPLAGWYFRALDSCPDQLLTESECIQTVHLLCNNIAIWNEGAALTIGPFVIEDGVVTLDGESGGAPLPIGPDSTYPYGAELTRHQFNGKQCR